MNNILIFQNGVTEESVANALTISNCDVKVWRVSSQWTGYGHWKVTTELEVNGKEIKCSITTTDSVSIDNWNEDESVIDGFAAMCIERYQDELTELVWVDDLAPSEQPYA